MNNYQLILHNYKTWFYARRCTWLTWRTGTRNWLSHCFPGTGRCRFHELISWLKFVSQVCLTEKIVRFYAVIQAQVQIIKMRWRILENWFIIPRDVPWWSINFSVLYNFVNSIILCGAGLPYVFKQMGPWFVVPGLCDRNRKYLEISKDSCQ